jgi:hypothetical protein
MVLYEASSIICDRRVNFFEELVNGFTPFAKHFRYEDALNDKWKIVGELPCTSPA